MLAIFYCISPLWDIILLLFLFQLGELKQVFPFTFFFRPSTVCRPHAVCAYARVSVCGTAPCARACVCVWKGGLRLCQVVFPDNRITILSLFTVSEPVGWIKHCMVDSAGGT